MSCQYVAQLAEHWTSIPKVAGSIPTVAKQAFQLARCGCTLRVTSNICHHIHPSTHNTNTKKPTIILVYLFTFYILSDTDPAALEILFFFCHKSLPQQQYFTLTH